MKPKPFKPQVYEHDERYIRDHGTGLVWHRCMHRALYADTDRSTVVYHANYLRYFEIGRTSLMRDAAYPYRLIEENGYVYPIIELSIHFYGPLYYDDTMWIHTRPAAIERVKLGFNYVITHGETAHIICEGFTKHCALNTAGRVVAVDSQTAFLWEAFPK